MKVKKIHSGEIEVVGDAHDSISDGLNTGRSAVNKEQRWRRRRGRAAAQRSRTTGGGERENKEGGRK